MTKTLKDTPEEKTEICEKAFKSIYPSCECKDDNLLESLKDILGNDRAERIKNFNRYNKAVLFISENISLIRGAVAYLWYTNGQSSPPHVLDCSGLKEDEILKLVEGDWIDAAFTNIEFCTYLGGVLFFEDLNPHENILKRLRSIIGGNKGCGILVAGMNNKGNLSQRFLNNYFLIALEPENQDTPVSTPQDTAKHQALVTPKDIKEIHYDDKKGKLFVDKISVILTHTEKVFFEYFWDKGKKVGVDDVIEHMTNFVTSNNTSWDRGYFGKTLSSINHKSASLGVKKLIRNVSHGKKEYEISIRVIKKTFKS